MLLPNMKKLLSHLDFTRIGHYQSILQQQGHPCIVKNANAASVMGEIPYTEVWPELWILDELNYDKAVDILKEYDDGLPETVAPWLCPKCKTTIETGFGECWNCGTVKDA